MNFQSGRRYSLAAVTGVMAAALAANSPIFGMRIAPSPGNTMRARIDRVRLQWTTLTGFTTPVTAGRRLELIRASAAPLGGGSAITDIGKRYNGLPESMFDESNGGDVRIATTAALTQAGVVYEPVPVRIMTLSHVGAAGGFSDREYIMEPSEEKELVLAPGELMVIRNPVAMDAAGTFQLGVEVDWREIVPTL